MSGYLASADIGSTYNKICGDGTAVELIPTIGADTTELAGVLNSVFNSIALDAFIPVL